jgi:hypothetical protein
MTVLCVAGALDVWRGPFVWSLLLAAMSTVSLISLVVLGTVPSIPHLLAVVGLWCAVAATAPVARILREHPDLYSAKYFRKGKGAKAIDGFDARRFGIWTAAALLIAALAGWKVRADRPPTFDDRAAEFAAVWNAADLQGVAAFFPPDKRDRLANSLERMVAYKAWDEHPTATLDRVFYETSTRVQVYFASAKGELLTHWRLRDGQWELTAVDLPDR